MAFPSGYPRKARRRIRRCLPLSPAPALEAREACPALPAHRRPWPDPWATCLVQHRTCPTWARQALTRPPGPTAGPPSPLALPPTPACPPTATLLPCLQARPATMVDPLPGTCHRSRRNPTQAPRVIHRHLRHLPALFRATPLPRLLQASRRACLRAQRQQAMHRLPRRRRQQEEQLAGVALARRVAALAALPAVVAVVSAVFAWCSRQEAQMSLLKSCEPACRRTRLLRWPSWSINTHTHTHKHTLIHSPPATVNGRPVRQCLYPACQDGGR
mmetsp:Transcript_22875/g.73644  ORF Transcript_22875/g.73644 Transcript_22875/m.73644 type:complete len:273 (-) Transcript_22875:215-1033(-)